MARGRSAASRIITYFQTAEESEARLIFGLCRDAISARFGKRKSAPKVARKQSKPQSTEVAA